MKNKVMNIIVVLFNLLLLGCTANYDDVPDKIELSLLNKYQTIESLLNDYVSHDDKNSEYIANDIIYYAKQYCNQVNKLKFIPLDNPKNIFKNSPELSLWGGIDAYEYISDKYPQGFFKCVENNNEAVWGVYAYNVYIPRGQFGKVFRTMRYSTLSTIGVQKIEQKRLLRQKANLKEYQDRKQAAKDKAQKKIIKMARILRNRKPFLMDSSNKGGLLCKDGVIQYTSSPIFNDCGGISCPSHIPSKVNGTIYVRLESYNPHNNVMKVITSGAKYARPIYYNSIPHMDGITTEIGHMLYIDNATEWANDRETCTPNK